MRPIFHAHLVNGASGDPVLYVDCLFEHRALCDKPRCDGYYYVVHRKRSRHCERYSL